VGVVTVLPGKGDGKPDLVLADDPANALVVLMNNYVAGNNSSGCLAVSPLSN
jgi:hypothetical protein